MQIVTSPTTEMVQTQLARIVESQHFRNAPRLSRFLTYVVEEKLAGHSDQLKGYTIGLEVFDKQDDFDPQIDTIVRVQARVLRLKLDEYYLHEGADDPIHIVIAKGGYDPAFYMSDECESPKKTVLVVAPAPAVSDKPSIAVLPFAHIGPASDVEFLSDGLTEGTISCLSRFKDLAVFSRSTTEKARLDKLSIPQMFELFHPDFVLEGSFSIREKTVETRIRLVNAASDEVLMTDRVNMQMDTKDIYQMQDEMAESIAARIGVEYGPIGQFARRNARSDTMTKWETYAWISRYYQYGLQSEPAGLDEFEAGLTHALSSDTTSAEGYAALSMIQIEQYRVMTANVGDPAKLESAMEHALLAVKLDPQSATAHQALALAYFHSRRFVDFRASMRRALHLNPGHSDMLAMFGICLVRLAEWDEAIHLLDRALALNPLHPNWYHMPKAMFLMMNRGPEEAIAELEKNPMPGFFAFHYLLVWFHVEAGNMAAAEVEKGRLLKIAPDTAAFTKHYFDVICLCDDIADRAIAAFRKVDLLIQS